MPSKTQGWPALLKEAREWFRSHPWQIDAYSEQMPPPWVGIKPSGAHDPLFGLKSDPLGWPISRWEEDLEFRPGLEKIARHVIARLVRLRQGDTRAVSRTLLADNPAWFPISLHGATPTGTADLTTLLLPLALSKTQDDKGRVRWTLLGNSQHGPERIFWDSFAAEAFPGGSEEAARVFCHLMGWLLGENPTDNIGELRRTGFRILPCDPDVESPDRLTPSFPDWARDLLVDEAGEAASARTLLTFRPARHIPESIWRARSAGHLRLLPSPESLLFGEHSGYRRLAAELPCARQIALLSLFPACESETEGLRIPASGWLDELPDQPTDHPHDGETSEGHRRNTRLQRSHRFQRHGRETPQTQPNTHLDDHVSIALFSENPSHLGLYGKPMAAHAQVWDEEYRLLFDGSQADRQTFMYTSTRLGLGGRFGFRMLAPPMQVGPRQVVWHRLLIARHTERSGTEYWTGQPLGPLHLERHDTPQTNPGSQDSVMLHPRLAPDPAMDAALHRMKSHPGERRNHVATALRKTLEWNRLLDRELPTEFAARLLALSAHANIESWLLDLPHRVIESAGPTPKPSQEPSQEISKTIQGLISPREAPPEPGHTFEQTRTRSFEESFWIMMETFARSPWLDKNNADPVSANQGLNGGDNGRKAGRVPASTRHLDDLADELHRRYEILAAKHEMSNQAFSADQWFRWNTRFAYPWSQSWLQNQNTKLGCERNVVFVIPGRNRGEAVIMADHYDTAYMEELFEPSRGGDGLRAAANGADDNHSATTTLLLAADVLLPLARAGRLERDVWLVHLTGEEFPADCLGARALASALLRRDLNLTRPDNSSVDLSQTIVTGAFVLDMIAHNKDSDRNVFQIAPGEGKGSAHLAWITHQANRSWNAGTACWNEDPARRAAKPPLRNGRLPELFPHLAVRGEIRPEWEPRSALYNTDGQIFSDHGIPVVLFMENYDINRCGYHDLNDTMAQIDLDYGAAVAAIAIEAVARAAMEAPHSKRKDEA